MNSYYVYILTNRRRQVLYIGMTNDIARRVSEHKSHVIEGFTKKYNVDVLVYAEAYSDVKEAIAREKQLKKWSSVKKRELVSSVNPEWEEISPF